MEAARNLVKIFTTLNYTPPCGTNEQVAAPPIDFASGGFHFAEGIRSM
jgi:hypothetical protein